ncbi:hypothetical protein CI102_11463 [Trichoderma harzianum]|uniref:Uncharacterized protein n=1 Tax=Trichoderma harzianum CBS 226.95 TaxID=983964 RepID=A0A2T4AK77_TRIHA|nr:hypothetical protein M431DRAFT_505026 [Trichoderma harzianum CBS 226.95]PKK44223.1 hypothetical protein CI102_11463 [Trichoderma harzianum]PTB57469.1 hypothetical protein M431DRAFT_505026 [Trichoderma harzianum CBS 226.95]
MSPLIEITLVKMKKINDFTSLLPTSIIILNTITYIWPGCIHQGLLLITRSSSPSFRPFKERS